MDNSPAEWILYLDEHLLAINKPSSLRVLPDGYHPETEHVRSLLEPLYGRLWIIHRLDKETSGVLVLARSVQAHRALNLQFDRRLVEKTYHALVSGNPTWNEVTIDCPLRVNGDRRHRTVVDFEHGKAAITHCKRIESFETCTLLAVQPRTGRTHQIRAHLAHLGHPILGDPVYGHPRSQSHQTFLVERLALHAQKLIFHHPVNNRPLRVEAPYPADFHTWLERLRNAIKNY